MGKAPVVAGILLVLMAGITLSGFLMTSGLLGCSVPLDIAMTCVDVMMDAVPAPACCHEVGRHLLCARSYTKQLHALGVPMDEMCMSTIPKSRAWMRR